MDPTRFLSSLLGGVIDTRPKKHDKLSRFLSGSSGSVWNAKTLLTAGALGWAAYEIFRTKSGSGAAGATTTFPGQTVVAGTTVVPSLPPSTSVPNTPPPLPPGAAASTGSDRGSSAGGPPVEPVRRLVGVLLAAARADGELGEAEYGRLLGIAREAGGSALVGEELRNPTPIERLAGGIPEPRAREDLYRLAFGIVRCDEGVSAAERAWLARLAGALGLDASSAARLERETSAGIAAA
ncbi:MAG: DUF533 domain-containing protein [Planctomycetota bacterium]|nr:DUF533 domain-containing protein [Planctomycetota bacterium]